MVQGQGTIVITGGTVGGVGHAAAVALAEEQKFSKIVLTVRTTAKGDAACDEAARLSGRPREMISFVVMDLTDHSSVRSAVELLPEKIDVLLMNAGGLSNGDGKTLTKEGATPILANNVLGHVVLLEALLKQGKISGDGGAKKPRVIYAGSEASRGVWLFAGFQPFVECDQGKLASYVTKPPSRHTFGIAVRKRMAAYANAKLLGTLYVSKVARERPDIYFATVSPGGVAQTNARDHAPQPLKTVMGWPFFVKLLGAVSGDHPMSVAVDRYVQAVCGHDFTTKFSSGSVVGAPQAFPNYGPCGPMVNQNSMSAHFGNVDLQDEAASVVRAAAA